MINKEELLKLISQHESDRVEMTESTQNTDKFSQAVCAFANDLPARKLPGYLIIGVKDDGGLSGLTVTDQLLQNLAALRSDGNIEPLPVINVAKFSLEGGEIAVVEVLPSDIPPVRYKGKICVRVGPRRAIANAQEEKMLIERRTALAKTFDALPCLESSIDDLALDLFLLNYRIKAIAPEILAENHREVPFQLASLRFFNLDRQKPTHAGILLFGKNPLYFLPGAYIQFLRFDGDSYSSEIKMEKRLSGDLLTVLRELDSLIKIQITEYSLPETHLKQKRVSDYPIIALRELLMNAVMHRSYNSTAPIRFYWFSDRIEIQNTGGLYDEASEKNFPTQNTYRNPVIAEAMKTLGYVERFGLGVDRAQSALMKNESKPADFYFTPEYVLVTLWKRE